MIRFGIWPLRVTWLLLPLLAGPVLAGALDDTSRPVQIVASLGLWGGWLTGFLAALMPRTTTLTALRVLAPAGMASVTVAAVAADAGDVSAPWRAAGLAAALVAGLLAFFPATGRVFVDGSSYGDEARFPLRVPAPLLAGPVPLAWLAAVGGVSAGPLLLAAKQWIAGVPCLVVGLAAAYWGVRALHVLARRWVVLVPAGLVLHDPLALTDPVLFRRQQVKALEPALADSGAVDLTRGALGLALELQLVEAVPLTAVAERPGAAHLPVETDRILFTPSEPGALIAAARTRRIG